MEETTKALLSQRVEEETTPVPVNEDWYALREKQEQKLADLLVDRFPKMIDDNTIHGDLLSKCEEAMEGVTKIMRLAGDVPRDGTEETPFRVLKSYLEMTTGYGEDPKEHLAKDFEANTSGSDIVLVRDIPFNSLCEHHLVPFYGTIHIAYIPGERITGLSKFARLSDGYAKRFQVQENLTTQIADAIEEVLRPIGCAVIINAEHYCMCGRGVHKAGASTTTSTMRGVFAHNPAAKQELLSLLAL